MLRLAASPCRYLRTHGGALINVGSALCDRAIPLQGNYCAAKHALKGFTDALRMELEEEGAPISVTLVKPASIDTPFFEKARCISASNRSRCRRFTHPELVANAILAAAERPVRDLIVGGSGRLLSLSSLTPRVTDAYMERRLFESQKTDRAGVRAAGQPVRSSPARRRRARPQLEGANDSPQRFDRDGAASEDRQGRRC